MANAHATYKNSFGQELSLSLDIDLKSERVQDIFFKGSLKATYEAELLELKNLIANKSIDEIKKIKRSDLKMETLLSSKKLALGNLSLWLLNNALMDYLGTTVTLPEQKDALCLCFGVTRSDLTKEILKRADYDLLDIVAETMATSACASCLPSIRSALIDLRSEYGLIKGVAHSQTRFDKEGHWVKIKGMYPAEIVVLIDDLKRIWMKREAIDSQFIIELLNIEGHHLWFKVQGISGADDPDRFKKILDAFMEYLKSQTGILFFLHLVS